MDRRCGCCEQQDPGLDRAGQAIGSAGGDGEIQTEFAIERRRDERPQILPCGDRLNQIAAPAPDGRLHRKPAICLHTEHHIGQQTLADAKDDQEPGPGPALRG